MATLRKPRGYVLLMVLIVLTMAATLLVIVGQLAIGAVRTATSAESSLQRKWATASAQRALLPNAEALLAVAEANEQTPIARLDQTIRLGELTIVVAVCDEQAKANINQLLETADDSTVSNRLQNAWSGSGLINSIHLRLAVGSPAEPGRIGPARLIRSFGQILDPISPEPLFARQSVGAQLTCFGSGAINVQRADEPALRLALPSFSQIEIHRVLATREQRWRGTVSSGSSPPPKSGDPAQLLLDAANISPRARLKTAVTGQSTCHSLWIVVKDQRRVWYNWSVLDEATPRQPLRSEFDW